MGNAAPGGREESDDEDSSRLEDKGGGDGEDGLTRLDMCHLFDSKRLRELLCSLSEPEERVKKSFRLFRPRIAECLSDRQSRHESTVSVGQFIEAVRRHSMTQDFTQEECIEFFSHFDPDNEGTVNLAVVKKLLRAFDDDKDGLSASVNMLQNSPLLPSFVDAFAGEHTVHEQHGKRLLQFLLRNRAPNTELTVPVMEGFNNTSKVRTSILRAHVQAVANMSVPDKKPSESEDSVVELIREQKCFSRLEVSSNEHDAHRLLNGQPLSYWQSSGAIHNHWIKLHMRPGVVVRRLLIGVNSNDQSYMPANVCVAASHNRNHTGNSIDLATVNLPSSFTGEYLLVENLKVHYPYIIIAIRRCQSDGHDTRVRSVSVCGTRVVSPSQPSLMDVATVWMMTTMTTTSQAAMAFAPQLRQTLLAQARMAISMFAPMSLSANSRERPTQLSPSMMDEMGRHCQLLSMDTNGDVIPEGLENLLLYRLARGNLADLLETATVVRENAGMELHISHALRQLQKSYELSFRTQGIALTLEVVDSDGGRKNADRGPECVLSDEFGTKPYETEEGKKHVNIMFKTGSANPVFVTAVSVKMPKGGNAPQQGVVIGLCLGISDNPKDYLEKFTSDSWTTDNYNEKLKEFEAGNRAVEGSMLIGKFVCEDSWDVIDIQLEQGRHRCTHIVLKFIGTQSSAATYMSVGAISFHGYEESALLNYDHEQLKTLAPLPNDESPVNGASILLHLLVFLVEMAQHLALAEVMYNKKKKKKEKSEQPLRATLLDVEGLALQHWWKLYEPLIGRDGKQVVYARILCLHLLRLILRYLVPRHQHVRQRPLFSLVPANEKPKSSREDFDNVFRHLCSVVDDQESDSEMKTASEKIILDGAEVFFPDAETRCSQLLSMVEHAMSEKRPLSQTLAFESLCRYFSLTDSRDLLGLPQDVEKEELNKHSVLSIMTTLTAVAVQKVQNDLSSVKALTEPLPPSPMAVWDLVLLLCALQRSLFLWCAQQILPKAIKSRALVPKSPTDDSRSDNFLSSSSDSSDDEFDSDEDFEAHLRSRIDRRAARRREKEMEERERLMAHKERSKPAPQAVQDAAKTLVMEYTILIVSKTREVLSLVQEFKSQIHAEHALHVLEFSFVGTAFRQLVLFLGMFEDVLSIRKDLMHNLQPVAETLFRLSARFPSFFPSISATLWQETKDEAILRVWEVESPHNYPNHANYTQVFECPGCTHFKIEFDPQCETERRYDYLEFTDLHGRTRRFDNKVGSTKWPLQVQFAGGGRLQFLFHSDGSNNEWGYKFKVYGVGKADLMMPWTLDLQLGLSQLLGRMCSAALQRPSSVTPANLPEPSEPLTEEQEQEKAAKAEAQQLLQRLWATLFRGGYMVQKLTRSLSRKFMASPVDSKVNHFLKEVAENKDGRAADLLLRCQKTRRTPAIGGAMVNSAVAAVFAALMWHTQSLKEEVRRYVEEEVDYIPETITQAYSSADTLRRQLVDRRQRLVRQAEDPSLPEDERAKINPDAPAIAARNKALFLLKFSSLSRGREDEKKTQQGDRPRWLMRTDSWDRVLERVSSEGQFEQLKAFAEEGQAVSRNPVFRQVLDVVTNEHLTEAMITEKVDERRQKARMAADAYFFAAEYMRLVAGSSATVELPSLLFLQNLLASQYSFPRHYAEGLDGCGLELESQVRRSYYLLTNRLMDMAQSMQLKAASAESDAAGTSSSRLAFQLCLLHLLDVNWEDYDYMFIRDIQLPEFFMKAAKESVAGPTMPPFEKWQLDRYHMHQAWLPDAENDMKSFSKSVDDMRERQIFISMYSCRLSNIYLMCDNCNKDLSPSDMRYRCLSCTDFDLCRTCFEVLKECPKNSASDRHEINCMRYTCDNCQAFIVGTRIRCDVCDDFDLCLGCHYGRTWPSRHSSAHSVTRHSTIVNRELVDDERKENYSPSSAEAERLKRLTSYSHQHSWTLFSVFTLSLARLLETRQQGLTSPEPDYVHHAVLLLRRCVRLLTESLLAISVAATEKAAEKRAAEEFKRQEEDKKRKGEEEGTVEGDDGAAKATQGDGDATNSSPEPGEAASSETANEDKAASSAGAEDEVKANVSADAEAGKETVAVSAAGSEGNLHGDTGSEPAADSAVVAAPANITISDEHSAEAGDVSATTPGLTPQDSEVLALALTPPETPVEVSVVGGNKRTTSETPANDKELSVSDKEFANNCAEEIIGLLGALLSPKNLLTVWARTVGDSSEFESFLQSNLLPSLFKLIRNVEVSPVVQNASLTLLGQLLAQISPAVSDHSLATDDSQQASAVEEPTCGQQTLGFLFDIGAARMSSSDLQGAALVANVLQTLCKCDKWKVATKEHVSSCVERLSLIVQGVKEPDLGAIFGVSVITGFPKVLHSGVIAKMQIPGSEEGRQVVVISHNPGSDEAEVVDLSSRLKSTVEDSKLTVDMPAVPLESSSFPKMMDLLKQTLPGPSSSEEDDFGSVENTLVLSLVLKATLGALQGDPTTRHSHLVSSDKQGCGQQCCHDLIKSGLIPKLVRLAGRGTGFSIHWKVQHLEVLAFSIYRPVEPEKDNNKEDDDGKAEASEKKDEGEKPSRIGPLDGLNEDARDTLLTIHHAFNTPLSLLRAMYELAGHKLDQFVEQIHRLYDGTTTELDPGPEARQAAAKWETDTKAQLESPINAEMDNGLRKFSSVGIDLTKVEPAEEQCGDILGKQLIQDQTEIEMAEAEHKSRLAVSRSMLNKELAKHKKSATPRSVMTKWQRAVAILQARCVVAQVLACWPPDVVLSSELLGGEESSRESTLLSLLDLLQASLPPLQFQKALSKAVQLVDKPLLGPSCLAACSCMAEAKRKTCMRESEHKYKNNASDEGKVVIEGATSLHIQFDPKCSTEAGCDILTLSSSAAFSQSTRFEFSGGTDNFKDFDMAGDTVHYRFRSDSSHTEWGWRMIVSGGDMGRFETGFTLIIAILDGGEELLKSLPLPQLWNSLIQVACVQTGNQRIKVLGLILKLLRLLAVEDLPEDRRPNLTLLRPLWMLYTKMLDTEPAVATSPVVTSSLLRALTEVFFVVENLAQDWGQTDDFIVGMATADSLKHILEKGIRAVAFIGAAINLPNKATEIFEEEYRKEREKPPPVAARKTKRSSSGTDSDDDDDGCTTDMDSDNGFDDLDDFEDDHMSDYDPWD